MYCRNCGNKIEDGCKFCPNCGAAVTPADAKPDAGTSGNPFSANFSPDNGAAPPQSTYPPEYNYGGQSVHPSCGADTLPGVEGRISSARQKRGQRRARRGDRLCGDRSALRHHSHSDNRRGRLVGVGYGARIGSRIASGPTAKDEKEHRFRGVLFFLCARFSAARWLSPRLPAHARYLRPHFSRFRAKTSFPPTSPRRTLPCRPDSCPSYPRDNPRSRRRNPRARRAKTRPARSCPFPNRTSCRSGFCISAPGLFLLEPPCGEAVSG